MIYRKNQKNGDELSALGYGCMRFPKDEGEAEKQVLSAIAQGVNYFDTAYIYPGSEAALGRILAKNNCREKVKIATKMPPYLVRKYEDFDRLFNAQLKRLQTSYIDYYLMHALAEKAQWDRLLSLGILNWIRDKKAAGQIFNIGFSYHGGRGEFAKLIDAHSWDFCMIQYNYLDENNQAGKSGLGYAYEKGVPVMIMEPLRGGMLAGRLPKEATAVWESAPVRRSPAEWGLRWVWNHPEALCVLSGMSTMEMVDENVRIASDAQPGALSGGELALYDRVCEIINDKTKVPCTGCGYCLPCPSGVDIPLCFSLYNNAAGDRKMNNRISYINYVGGHNASKCTLCGKCEKHCPQNIAIRDALRDTAKEMESFPYRPLKFIMGKFMKN